MSRWVRWEWWCYNEKKIKEHGQNRKFGDGDASSSPSLRCLGLYPPNSFWDDPKYVKALRGLDVWTNDDIKDKRFSFFKEGRQGPEVECS